MSIPMRDLHLLNIKTSKAESVGILRVHHSIGDGVSLMSLFISCSRKVSDPDALPTLPASKKQKPCSSSGGFLQHFIELFSVLLIYWNTLVDVVMFLITILFLDDTKTPLKGPPGVGSTPRRIVHRVVSLDDVKLVKNAMNAMNATINDVMVGVTQAALSRYLNRKYGKNKKGGAGAAGNSNLPKNIRLRATSFVNLRPYLRNEVRTTISLPLLRSFPSYLWILYAPLASSINLLWLLKNTKKQQPPHFYRNQRSHNGYSGNNSVGYSGNNSVPLLGSTPSLPHTVMNNSPAASSSSSSPVINSQPGDIINKDQPFFVHFLYIYDTSETMKSSSDVKLGNLIGYVLFPFTIALREDALDYVRSAKAAGERKKATLEAVCTYFMAKTFIKFFGTKLGSFPTQTTFWFSNIPGPQEEITFFGYQVTYIAPTCYGNLM
ncbi:hypothetical protein DKX38_029514 [Salix brachista]|uniref:O-acyltransferase WSD1 C-terminal domain-containing protein n=1 Tax=Salix brachista TaxID=2182728 RepID=A0A5N5J1R1_9ROSI|nr:hypothetical protein DKX38_029514 [Salix brachista]